MTLRSSKEEVRDRNEIKKVNNLLITFRAGDQVRFPREKMCEKGKKGKQNKTAVERRLLRYLEDMQRSSQ